MNAKYPELPIPFGAASTDGIDIAAMPEHGLPSASVTFNLFRDQEGHPSIAVGLISFLWDKEAPPWPQVPGRLPKCDVRVCDTGQVAVEFDSLGRVDNIEATSYIPGTRWIPEAVALSVEECARRGSRHHVILSGIATIMRYWPAFETKWRRGIEATKQKRQSREWGVLDSTDRYADCW